MDLQNIKKFVELIAAESNNKANVEYFFNPHVSGFRLSVENEENELWDEEEYPVRYSKSLSDNAFEIVAYLSEINLISDYQKVSDSVFILFN